MVFFIEHPIYDGQTFNVPQDDSITIYCTATGYPTPSLPWAGKDGAELNNERFSVRDGPVKYSVSTNLTRVTISLIITNASRDDIGQYMCIAKNFLDDNVNRTFNVFVQCMYVHLSLNSGVSI